MSPELQQQRAAVLEVAARLTEARKLFAEGVALLEQENYEPAAELIMRAAEMGDSAAQCQLGFLYENGFFGNPNDDEAVRWYRKSAEQCLPNGQFRLGACYQLGKGVAQDYLEAARLFSLAARRGHADAAEALQMLRDMGVGEAPEPPAKALASPPAPPPMPDLPPDLDDPAVTDAVAAYQTQALQNNASAQLKLGLAYHVGRSAPKNPKLACFWVMRAMLAGDFKAGQFLEYCTRALAPGEHGALQSKIFMWVPGQPVPPL
jgi:TPR repeat protein